ncbi:Protein tyrosine phosphatase domain-containing protein 1 [Trichinella sp. T6]|nr:Protein tyrosine phosphatase domain-containing protein 1 [Trichinella sp. T6]
MSTDGRRSHVWNSFRRKKSESMDKERRRLDNNGTYGTVRETLLRLVPRNSLCRMFCHGSKCKYCNPDLVPDNMKIIDGIYSTWITEDILAIARPSDEGIERFQLIEQLAKCGVKSIFNLQLPFEHAHCGNPLTEHGFSYDPEIFMEHGMAHYNFGWPDFGIASVEQILDVVKVMQHALDTGGKIAVHCHAGLGRTGTLICCFLIWNRAWTAEQALQHVRSRRPGSVQSASQQSRVENFQAFVESLKPVFDSNLDFDEHLKRQALVLYGLEARVLKNIPKIAFVVCEVLLELFGLKRSGHVRAFLQNESSLEKWSVDTRGNLMHHVDHQVDAPSDTIKSPSANPITFANVINLMQSANFHTVDNAVQQLQEWLNRENFNQRWFHLADHFNPVHQLTLLGCWFCSLKEPMLNSFNSASLFDSQLITGACAFSDNHHRLSRGQFTTTMYICRTFVLLSGRDVDDHNCRTLEMCRDLLTRWFASDADAVNVRRALDSVFHSVVSELNLNDNFNLPA